ncbi:epidermal growth factor receptor kinase substrate 8-like protein 3 [Lates japonicus]|uniref:Epidermal growth factor receptor kinase substrate 8-like protein 3 n=1 Tax=Lates japonicus TaxID=270547 RepID=A0AAD3QU92_LATJO|nr:epidermal growth factor receptor kinase substrate 8-like protein 3 [Lates japonicus]
MYGNPGPFSYSPGGFTPEDFPQQRRTFQQDDLRGSPLQRNNMSRPSGRSIYMQRKEYSETLNRQADNFHVRVEHLFTCELNGQDMKTVDDCVAKLKRLDTKGRLWPQDMIIEVQGGYLLLNDIETKTELESLPLSAITQTSAVLDSCAYNSLLTITVQERSKRVPQVYMFQCEDTGAELIKSDLDKVVQTAGGDVEPNRNQSDIRSDLENIIGQRASSFRQPGPRAVLREMTPPPPEYPPPQWGNREPEIMPSPRGYTPQEEMMYQPPELQNELQNGPEINLEQANAERNTDILNHVIGDLEIFMDKLSAAVNAPSLQEDMGKKKNAFKKKKTKKNAPVINLPPWEEYVSCLQKIKYGFNLLGQLDGTLNNPSAPDFVHIFFSNLELMVPRYPTDLPPTVVSPLLTDVAVQLLGQVVSPQEENLWRFLGDAWNVPRSRWPEIEISPYIPEFYDGWQPPAPPRIPSPVPFQNGPMSRSNSQRFPNGRPNGHIDESQSYSPRARLWQPEEPFGSLPPPTRPSEPPLYMRVIYNFMARNNQELSIMKGEVVQVIQKSKQWWLVRNTRDEEGSVPQNVLEPIKSDGHMEDLPRDTRGPVTLDMSSSPAEVRAWLQHKGFSKITVTSLGVLSGSLLLGMTKDEIRTVCPEEGSKVFFQLQGVKAAIALASEPSGMYNSRY